MTDRATGLRGAGGGEVEGLSGRAMARALGVSEMAVRKAFKAGRFTGCFGRNAKGHLVFTDVELAKRQWKAGGRRAQATGGAKVTPPDREPSSQEVRGTSSRPALAPANPEDPAGAGATLISATTLVEAQFVATMERARKLQLENDVSEGRLVPVEQATKEAFDAGRVIRESILNLPARLAGELAAETEAGRVQLRLDQALREILNGTADALQASAVNE